MDGARQRPFKDGEIVGPVTTPEEAKEQWHDYLHEKKSK